MHQNGQLEVLRKELGRQSRALAEVRGYLPAELAGHLSAVRINPPELLLYTDSSAWAARLRFHAPKLLATLRRAMPSLASVKVKIVQAERAMRRGGPGPALSSKAASAIREAGESIDDPALREALLRLARAGKVKGSRS